MSIPEKMSAADKSAEEITEVFLDIDLTKSWTTETVGRVKPASTGAGALPAHPTVIT
jgi:hypothetical protein